MVFVGALKKGDAHALALSGCVHSKPSQIKDRRERLEGTAREISIFKAAFLEKAVLIAVGVRVVPAVQPFSPFMLLAPGFEICATLCSIHVAENPRHIRDILWLSRSQGCTWLQGSILDFFAI